MPYLADSHRVTRILAIGTGPLYAPDVRVFNGQALRTWHLTKPLVDAGHDVRLVVLPVEGQPKPFETDEVLLARTHGDFPYTQINTIEPAAVQEALRGIVADFQPEGIVAINHNAVWPASTLPGAIPLWADLNGAMMGEAQVKAKVYKSDDYLQHFWRRMSTILRRGDRFSCVSFKQMYATVGELGAVGRLNQHTANHPFLSVIPNAVCEVFLQEPELGLPRKYRGALFPADSFAVLWSGGFNTWTDTRTLAGALSMAMEQESRIRFVATGGAIPGHDEVTYEQFKSEMDRTGFLDRCHFLGWVEWQELAPLYRECDVGINIDGKNYETLLGARNRLTNMMGIGLPVLTTLGTELSEIIEESRLGYVVRIGQVQELADALLRACRSTNERRVFANRARKFAMEQFSYAATTRGLVQWSEAPATAPDNAEKVKRFNLTNDQVLVETPLNTLETEAELLDKHSIPALLRSEAELNGIRSKRLYRLYKTLFR